MPQRFLRPGITASPKWENCCWQTQTFFVRLITLVDDFGRYDADPRLLRSHAFPLRNDITAEIVLKMCAELSKNGLGVFYNQDGKTYLQLTNWQERPRAEHSRYPQFDNTCEQMFAKDSKCSLPSSSSSSSSFTPKGGCNHEGLNRVKRLFHKRETTPLDRAEQQAWSKAQSSVESTTEEAWAALEWTYAQRNGDVSRYRRKDMATLLNNWNGQIERSKAWKSEVGKSVL